MANGAPTVSNGLVISGVTTSTTFSGSGASLTNLPAAQLTGTLPAIDGSNLTNITSTTINNNGSNRIITGSSTANTLEGEATFTYDGTSVAKIDTSQTYATFRLDGNAGGAIEFYENGTRRFEIYGIDAEVALYDRDKGAYHTRFKSGGNVEISDGNLLIGTTTAAISAGKGLMIANSSGARIKLCDSDQGVTASDGFEIIQSNNGTGYIYNRENQAIIIGTNNTERMRVTHEGSVGIGTNNSTYELEVHDGTGAAALRMKDGANNVICDLIANSTGGLLRTTYNHPLVFHTNQVERMRIDTNGIVTMPNQPAFRAYISGGPQSINGTIPFSQNDYNIGSNYNTSNYRFTAPVAGRYQFNFYSIYRGNHTNNYFGFLKNGASFNGDRAHFTHPNLGSAWDYIDMSQVLNLSAGDYVTCVTHNAVDLHGGNWAAFSGHLVG